MPTTTTEFTATVEPTAVDNPHRLRLFITDVGLPINLTLVPLEVPALARGRYYYDPETSEPRPVTTARVLVAGSLTDESFQTTGVAPLDPDSTFLGVEVEDTEGEKFVVNVSNDAMAYAFDLAPTHVAVDCFVPSKAMSDGWYSAYRTLAAMPTFGSRGPVSEDARANAYAYSLLLEALETTGTMALLRLVYDESPRYALLDQRGLLHVLLYADERSLLGWSEMRVSAGATGLSARAADQMRSRMIDVVATRTTSRLPALSREGFKERLTRLLERLRQDVPLADLLADQTTSTARTPGRIGTFSNLRGRLNANREQRRAEEPITSDEPTPPSISSDEALQTLRRATRTLRDAQRTVSQRFFDSLDRAEESTRAEVEDEPGVAHHEIYAPAPDATFGGYTISSSSPHMTIYAEDGLAATEPQVAVDAQYISAWENLYVDGTT